MIIWIGEIFVNILNMFMLDLRASKINIHIYIIHLCQSRYIWIFNFDTRASNRRLFKYTNNVSSSHFRYNAQIPRFIFSDSGDDSGSLHLLLTSQCFASVFVSVMTINISSRLYWNIYGWTFIVTVCALYLHFTIEIESVKFSVMLHIKD